VALGQLQRYAESITRILGTDPS